MKQQPTAAPTEPFETSRLAGFSDGVFAVAITLLVLNIQVPNEAVPLREMIARQDSSIVVFVVTFAMVGIKWLNHHRMFAIIHRVDTTLNVLNLALLLGICAVPFTAATLAKYMTTPDAALASTIYGLVWTVNGFLYTAIFAYSQNKRLAEPHPRAQRIRLLYISGPLAYIVAIGISFVNIYAGVALYLVIVSLYIAPQRARER